MSSPSSYCLFFLLTALLVGCNPGIEPPNHLTKVPNRKPIAESAVAVQKTLPLTYADVQRVPELQITEAHATGPHTRMWSLIKADHSAAIDIDATTDSRIIQIKIYVPHAQPRTKDREDLKVIQRILSQMVLDDDWFLSEWPVVPENELGLPPKVNHGEFELEFRFEKGDTVLTIKPSTEIR